MDNYQYHIFSPYRVCPLGAHVDHQHGLVTGFAIDKGVDYWFNVREDGRVLLSSRTFDGCRFIPLCAHVVLTLF
jgi:galactokinase/galacturonokinase